MLFQLFNVFNARSDERSAFVGSPKIVGCGWAADCLSFCIVLFSTCPFSRPHSRL